MEEKKSLQEWDALDRGGASRPSRKLQWLLRAKLILQPICALILIFITGQTFYNNHFGHSPNAPSKYVPQCPAQEVIAPKAHPYITERNVEKLFQSSEFKELSIERLSGAVKIPTEDFDDMGPVTEDKRWDVFFDLAQYFKDTFPLL